MDVINYILSKKLKGDIGKKVDKVEGKGLSTNDYDDDAKSKVDAIPEDPKYTDTVYDDTEIKKDLENRATYVTPEMFGAIGDGVTDDTVAIQDAINASDMVVFGNKTYLVDKVQFDKSVELIGGSNTIIKTPTRSHGFYCAPQKIKARLSITADYEHLNYNSACGASRIAVNDASSIEIGDVLRIYAENQLYHPNRKYYYKGASVLVTDVDKENNYVSIGFVIPFDILAEGTVVDVYKANTVRIRNLKFESELEDDGSGSSFGLYLKCNKNSQVENCTFKGFTHNIYLDTCVNSLIRACQMAQSKRNNEFGWDGYGICIGSCNNTIIEQVICRCGQHALTTGGTIPVFNTHIRNCEMISECRRFAIGCHENNHDISIENSVIGGAWVTGNVNIRGARFVENEELGTEILITGNEGALSDIISFDNVVFDSGMRIRISAYTGADTIAFSNDVGRIVFNNCYGGSFLIENIAANTDITGSNIKSITVNNWIECYGFKLSYGTVEILKVDGLRFHLEVFNGFITSQTAIVIGSECNVLKKINDEDVVNSYDELAVKSPAIKSEEILGTDIEIEAGENTRIASLVCYGKTDEILGNDTIVFESDNLIQGLEDFKIEIHDTALNGSGSLLNFPKFKIPHSWKSKTFYLSATIDTTNANVESQNSVRVYLMNSRGEVIYTSGLDGKYEKTIYRSTVSFVIPDEAYYLVISAVLYAWDGLDAKAYDFKFYVNTEFKVLGYETFKCVPVASGGSFEDENGQQYLCNYLDFNNNVQIRQIEYLYNDRITEEMVTPMLDYFDDEIVGCFIPRENVERPDWIGRKLDNYASDLPILNSAAPPQNEESIWINDGGIGFAFSVANVGERTMAALVSYVQSLPWFLLCELYAPQSYLVNQTLTTQYNAIRLYGGRTRVYSKNGGYFKIGYYRDTKGYIDERINAAASGKYELISDITLTDEQWEISIENHNLKKVVIFSNAKFVDGTGVYGLKNINGTIENIPFGDNCNATEFTRGYLRLDCSEGLLLSCSSVNISNDYTYGYSRQPFKGCYEPILCDNITSLTIGSWNSYKFAVDSRFIIYGIKN